MYSRQAHKPIVLKLLPAMLVTVVLLLLSLSVVTSAAHAASAAPHVDVMTFNTDISPASLRYLTDSINTAESDGAQALVIQINTPGGDILSMESMKIAELNSKVPIISYVSP